MAVLRSASVIAGGVVGATVGAVDAVCCSVLTRLTGTTAGLFLAGLGLDGVVDILLIFVVMERTPLSPKRHEQTIEQKDREPCC